MNRSMDWILYVTFGRLLYIFNCCHTDAHLDDYICILFVTNGTNYLTSIKLTCNDYLDSALSLTNAQLSALHLALLSPIASARLARSILLYYGHRRHSHPLTLTTYLLLNKPPSVAFTQTDRHRFRTQTHPTLIIQVHQHAEPVHDCRASTHSHICNLHPQNLLTNAFLQVYASLSEHYYQFDYYCVPERDTSTLARQIRTQRRRRARL